MAVVEQPKQYVSGGKSFNTKAEAERYDELREALQKLQDAQQRYQRALGESCFTADGEPFKFGVFHDYWHVFKPYNSKPRLLRFDYVLYNWSVRDNRERPEVVEIAQEPREGEKPHYVPITQLYASEGKAKAALVVAQREWLEQQRKEIDASR